MALSGWRAVNFWCIENPCPGLEVGVSQGLVKKMS